MIEAHSPQRRARRGPLALGPLALLAQGPLGFLSPGPLALLAVVLLGLPAPAAEAQFYSLNRQTVTPQVRLDAGVVILDEGDPDSALRLEAFTEMGFDILSVYLAVPFAATLSGSPKNTTAFGNLEVGAAHRWDIGDTTSLVTHVGIVTPTGDNGPRGQPLVVATGIGRVTDRHSASLEDAWGVRIGTSPMFEVGPLFMQADVGLDFLFPDGDDEVGLHTNVGAGIDVRVLRFTAEVANAGLLTDTGEFKQTASLGGKLMTFQVTPYVVYTTPLDANTGQDFVVSFGISFGWGG